MKLHLGCGKRNFGSDWIHIDGSDYEHVQYHNITKLPFDDNTVDLIYASHVLEYFDRQEVVEVLKEWKRVLKLGGCVRLAVPDFAAMAKLYLDGYSLDKFVGPLYGRWQMKEDTIIYHKTVYDYVSLEKVLKDSGFENVALWNWQTTEHSHFDDYSQAYIPHMDKENGTLVSLNVEATKKVE